MARLRRSLPGFDGAQQPFEGAGEVRLVQHHEGVAAHQARRIGPHPPGDSVTLEEQTGADHVHGTDDDRRGGRIIEPFTIVHVLAAQGGDREGAVTDLQPPPHRIELPAVQPLTDGLGEIGGLIDHRSTVDDVDQAAGKSRSRGPRQQPERHDRGLAKAGREVDRRRQIADGKPLEQPGLPGKGLMPRQRLEGPGEVERLRHDSAPPSAAPAAGCSAAAQGAGPRCRYPGWRTRIRFDRCGRVLKHAPHRQTSARADRNSSRDTPACLNTPDNVPVLSSR